MAQNRGLLISKLRINVWVGLKSRSTSLLTQGNHSNKKQSKTKWNNVSLLNHTQKIINLKYKPLTIHEQF